MRGTGTVRVLVERAHRGVLAARADDVFLYSAALAFYGLVSVAPLVVVALWVTSLLVSESQVHQVAMDLARLAPESLGADRALERVADLGTTLGLTAIAAALWPATAYGSALVRVLDRVAGERAANTLRSRGTALLLVCVVPVLMLGSLVASYGGAAALGDTGLGLAIGLGLALVTAFTVTVATVAAVYKLFPRTPADWPTTLRGALVAAGIISVLSVGYVAYLRVGANFERRYASTALAAVALLGLWMFAVNVALVVGFRVVVLRRGRRGPVELAVDPEGVADIHRGDDLLGADLGRHRRGVDTVGDGPVP